MNKPNILLNGNFLISFIDKISVLDSCCGRIVYIAVVWPVFLTLICAVDHMSVPFLLITGWQALERTSQSLLTKWDLICCIFTRSIYHLPVTDFRVLSFFVKPAGLLCCMYILRLHIRIRGVKVQFNNMFLLLCRWRGSLYVVMCDHCKILMYYLSI